MVSHFDLCLFLCILNVLHTLPQACAIFRIPGLGFGGSPARPVGLNSSTLSLLLVNRRHLRVVGSLKRLRIFSLVLI